MRSIKMSEHLLLWSSPLKESDLHTWALTGYIRGFAYVVLPQHLSGLPYTMLWTLLLEFALELFSTSRIYSLLNSFSYALPQIQLATILFLVAKYAKTETAVCKATSKGCRKWNQKTFLFWGKKINWNPCKQYFYSMRFAWSYWSYLIHKFWR